MIFYSILLVCLLGVSIFILLPKNNLCKQYISIICFVLFSIAVFVQTFETLGKPKDYTWEWRSLQDAKIVGVSLQEGVGIYLMLQIEGILEPRYYELPWNIKSAQQLQNAMRQSEDNGGDTRMGFPTTPGIDDREPKFYNRPQSPGLDKDYD